MDDFNVLCEIAMLDGKTNPVKCWKGVNTCNIAFVENYENDVIVITTYSLNMINNEFHVGEKKYKKRKS